MERVSEVPLQFGDRQVGRQGIAVAHVGQRLDLVDQGSEELVGTLDRDERRSVETRSSASPVTGDVCAKNVEYQRVGHLSTALRGPILHPGPTADDEPAFVEDLVEQFIDRRFVTLELGHGIADVG